jgi:hypothetical protein
VSNRTSLAHAQILEEDQFCNIDQKPAAQPTAQFKQTSTGGDGSFLNYDHGVTSPNSQGRVQSHEHEVCQLSERKQNSVEASIFHSSSDCTNPSEGRVPQSQSSHGSSRHSPTTICQVGKRKRSPAK